MSLSDNALLTAHGHGLVKRGFISLAAQRAFTADIITRFDVRTSGPEAEAGVLSCGNLQKLIMGREVMLNPQMLLVLQPTWGIDIGAATDIRQRLVAMRNNGVAVLVISEEIEELFEVCDTLHVLYKALLSPAFACFARQIDQRE